MHIHIATAGETLEPIKLGFRAIPGIDKAYILIGKNYSEQKDEIGEFLHKMGIEYKIVDIDAYDFSGVMNKISDIHAEESKSEHRNTYSMNVTGSTKIAGFAAYSSAYFIGATVYYVRELSEEEKNRGLTLQDQLMTLVTTHAPKKSKTDKKSKLILDFILEETTGGKTVTSTKICDRFKFTKQQVAYYVKNLRGEGLIEVINGVEENGKTNYSYNSLRLTQQGQMVAKFT